MVHRSKSMKGNANDNEAVLVMGHDVPEFVRSDPGRLAQLMINLVANAQKFTVKGKIEVGVHKIAAPLENVPHPHIGASSAQQSSESFEDKDGSRFRLVKYCDCCTSLLFDYIPVKMNEPRLKVLHLCCVVFVMVSLDKSRDVRNARQTRCPLA